MKKSTKITLIITLVLCLVMAFALSVFANSVGDAQTASAQTPNEGGAEGSIAGEKELQFKIDGSSLGKTVPILCTGMIGIFIVTAIIIAIVLILNTTMTIIDNKKNK